MRRAGNLWPSIVSFDNLREAAELAAAGKRRRADVAAFRLELETELFALQRELASGSYRPGPYRTFVIHEPKARLISAAPFRDRVVHHAFTRVVEPIFERRFASHSYACRSGKGTHAALALARAAAARYRFALKLDVRKYFAAIDHESLKGLLERVIKCRRTLGLAAAIIDGSNEQPEVIAYYPGDTLFTPYERRRGLPLGNQTSQFFANVYLDPLDQMIQRELRPAAWARYVDDLLLFGDSKQQLGEWRQAIRERLWRLRLDAHAGKSRVYRVADGVTFLGWRIFPDRLRLVRGNVTAFRRRMRELTAAHAAGGCDFREVTQRVRSWLAHAAHGDTWRLREQLLDEFSFGLAEGKRSAAITARGLV